MTHRTLILAIFVIGILGNAQALAQGVEFFLRDDNSLDQLNPQDLLDELPPSFVVLDLMNPPDLDNDGLPGLTLVKGPDSADPLHFQEWVSSPLPEQCFSGFGRVHLYTVLKDFIDGESAAVNVVVQDRDPLGEETLIAQSGLVLDYQGFLAFTGNRNKLSTRRCLGEDHVYAISCLFSISIVRAWNP